MLESLLDEEKSKDAPALYSFDYYLSERLKYGPAQEKCSRALMIMLFSEGSESIVLGLIIPILSIEWGMTTFQKSLLITAVYLGATLGSALQTVADTYGRYSVITVAGVLQVVAGLLSVVAGEFSFFVVVRFVYGTAIGMVLPLSGTYIAEVTPKDKRAEYIVWSRIYWSAGNIFTAVLCYFFIAMAEEPRWRLILFLICLPGIYSMYVHFVHGKESPRYLLLRGRTEEARAIMSAMQADNNVKPLQHSEFQQMMLWVEYQQQHHGQELPVWDLFNHQYLLTTLKLWVAWFTVSFVYYGTMLLLPLILARKYQSTVQLNYIIILMVCLVELLGFYLSYNFMETPALGRKGTLRLAFALGATGSLVLLLLEVGPLVFGLLFMIIKFSTSLAFLTLYPYTAELYHTLLRSKALGWSSSVGRIGIMCLGTVGVYAMQWLDGRGLYLIFFVLALISHVCMTLMPYDTLGRELDSMKTADHPSSSHTS